VVAAMQRYPTAEKARGKVVTEWVEQLVEPATFGEYQFLKERTRWTVTVSARDDGSRVRVRHEAEFFAPVYTDSASPGWGADYYALWRGKSLGSDSSTTVSIPPNPWDKTRGAPVYVWRKESQIEGVSAQPTRERRIRFLMRSKPR
jgi:hypothetical protein